MKTISLLILISLTLSISAQTDEYTELKKEVDKKAETIREMLETEDYISDFERINTVGFKVDTFKVEAMLSGKMDIDYTTYSMIEAAYDAEKEYDKLLNKYYQILLKKLEPEDQESLKQVQRDWINFRDSEKKLAATLTQSHYTGGGTMYNITLAFETMKITKSRVLELYNHISRFYDYEY